MKPIRNSVKALIIKDGKLLVTKNRDNEGDFFLLPGGGQNSGETFLETLKRECREEIGADIKIGDLRFVREYIGRNHEFSSTEKDVHQVEFMFECEIFGDCEVKNGEFPDSWQIGVEWLEVSNLEKKRLYPKAICSMIKSLNSVEGKIYMGDVN